MFMMIGKLGLDISRSGQKNITGCTQNTSGVAGEEIAQLSLLLLPLLEVLVFTGKLLDPPRRIQKFFFARKEGMAARADIYRIILAGGRGLKGSATGAGNSDIV
jgi:hypothetical protein